MSVSVSASSSIIPNSVLEVTNKKNILIGCTGSVAALKIPDIIKKLMATGCFNIKLVTTERATHFFAPQDICGVQVLTDADEWNAWQKRGDPVVHINLSKWADLFAITPLDANTLAKIAGGLCDNLLTCVVRAWSLNKPLLFCPAMNTNMYNHPITASQISTLTGWGYIEIPAISKILICGDRGLGAMAEVDTIVEQIITHATKEQ